MSNLKKRINLWAKTCLWKIPDDRLIKAQFAMCNQACHFNAVQAVYAGRADKVWLAWGGGDNGCVHFINSKDGKFFDETWFDYENQNYRIIRRVKESEFDDIYDVLCNAKKHLIQTHGSWIDKLMEIHSLI